MVTDAFYAHDVPCPVLNSDAADYDATVAVAHDYDYYLSYYCYFAMIGAESFSYFSFDDFGTIFSPIMQCCTNAKRREK